MKELEECLETYWSKDNNTSRTEEDARALVKHIFRALPSIHQIEIRNDPVEAEWCSLALVTINNQQFHHFAVGLSYGPQWFKDALRIRQQEFKSWMIEHDLKEEELRTLFNTLSRMKNVFLPPRIIFSASDFL